MIKIQFPFDPSQRVLFQNGDLIDKWASQYPQLFDAMDVQITRNQTPYHFFEWLGAILLYEATGYLSLIEKYESTSHKRKTNIFRKTVPEQIYQHVMKNRSGVPDLFCYKEDYSDWFFCEVKGASDRLRPHQKEQFDVLERLSEKPISVLFFKDISS